jgi:hypothetical protein
MKKGEPKETPRIISELNAIFKPTNITVEWIAGKVGISKNILYEWVKTDTELSDALGHFKTLQEEDPFKTGTVEDSWIYSLVIAFILAEMRERYFKLDNI